MASRSAGLIWSFKILSTSFAASGLRGFSFKKLSSYSLAISENDLADFEALPGFDGGVSATDDPHDLVRSQLAGSLNLTQARLLTGKQRI